MDGVKREWTKGGDKSKTDERQESPRREERENQIKMGRNLSPRSLPNKVFPFCEFSSIMTMRAVALPEGVPSGAAGRGTPGGGRRLSCRKGGAAVPRERIGIMGGSFNPIHERHLEIAACAATEQRLDRVIFLPTGNPPHKHEGLAEAEHRYEMTRLSVSGMPNCEVSHMELDREGVIYTVDTLARLQGRYPGAELFYIIGEDTLFDLPNWRKPDRVFAMCSFLVCRRSSADPRGAPLFARLEARGARFTFLSLPPRNVSATEIRASLSRGETPENVKPQALEYIRVMGLYGAPRSPKGAAAMYPRLRQALSEKRLVHSLLVAYTARELAARHGVNAEQAALASLLHDCAKCMPLSEMQQIARNSRLLLDKETMRNGNLLHGPVGAAIAEKEYGVTDLNVLSAIRCHTTGKIGMLPLDMIVFLADKIEPSRRGYPALEVVRRLSRENLAAAMRYSLESTMEYVSGQKTAPHPATRRVLDWLSRIDGVGPALGDITKERTI